MEHFEKFVTKNNTLCERMKGCDHGYDEHINPYHAEGSVWTHTMMVMNEFKAHRMSYDTSLKFATMLHDTGKVDTREVKTKDNGDVRVRFFGHSGFSFYRAIGILDKIGYGLTLNEKIEILNIIALHGDFYEFVRGDEVSNKMIRGLAARFKDNYTLLKKVLVQVQCDCNGRHSFQFEGRVDTSALMDAVVPYFTPSTPKVQGSFQPCVTMMVGPPGCGKSTWFKNNSVGNVLSRDDIVLELSDCPDDYLKAFRTVDQKEVDKEHKVRLRNLVNGNKSFVIDECHMSRKSRRKQLSQIPSSYWKKAVILATDYDTIIERNKNREGKVIPPYVIHNMIRSFMVPMYDEFDEIEWVF